MRPLGNEDHAAAETYIPTPISSKSTRLTIPLKSHAVPTQPGSSVTPTLDPVRPVTLLPETPRLSPSTSKPSKLPMLMVRVTNPVNPRIAPNLLMTPIYQNHLIIFHHRILINPITIQNPQIRKLPPHLLLRHALQIPLKLQLVNTLMLGLTPNHTAVVLPLAATATNATADDDVALFGFVAEAMGLVGTGGADEAGDFGALAVFPGADAEEEAEGVRLFVTPCFFEEFVGSHNVLSLLLFDGPTGSRA